MAFETKRVAVITGACGGMGIACARLLGRSYRLVLADVDEARVGALADDLSGGGHDIAGRVAGDIADDDVLARLAEATRAAGVLGGLVHTAGLSPALAGWEAIIRTNLVATHKLLDRIEPLLTPGAAAVMIASMAGHRGADAELDEAGDDPLAADLLQKLHALMAVRVNPGDPVALGTVAYSVSKRAVIRMAEARAVAWARLGARIATISPGLIYTPMGRLEVERGGGGAASLQAATPLARWGTPLDIANAVEFLLSDRASFITGTDLRVDGGGVPGLMGVTF